MHDSHTVFLEQPLITGWVDSNLQTMDVSFAAAEKYIESQSVRALAALAPPTWTQAVVGTAAAMILETARPICAKQLIQEVILQA